MSHRCDNCEGIDPPSCLFNPDRSTRDNRLEREIFGREVGHSIQAYLDYHQAREARPRLACSNCQFEYVKEDGHECDQRTVLPPA